MNGWRLISDEDVKGKCKECNKVVTVRLIVEKNNNSIRKTPVCLECGAEGFEKMEIISE